MKNYFKSSKTKLLAGMFVLALLSLTAIGGTFATQFLENAQASVQCATNFTYNTGNQKCERSTVVPTISGVCPANTATITHTPIGNDNLQCTALESVNPTTYILEDVADIGNGTCTPSSFPKGDQFNCTFPLTYTPATLAPALPAVGIKAALSTITDTIDSSTCTIVSSAQPANAANSVLQCNGIGSSTATVSTNNVVIKIGAGATAQTAGNKASATVTAARSVAITGISTIGLNYSVAFTTVGYTPNNVNYDVHFYYNTEANTVTNKIHTTTTDFETLIANKPSGATQLCAIVGLKPGNTILNNSGNCYNLSFSPAPNTVDQGRLYFVGSNGATPNYDSVIKYNSTYPNNQKLGDGPVTLVYDNLKNNSGAILTSGVCTFQLTRHTKPVNATNILKTYTANVTNGTCTATMPVADQTINYYHVVVSVNNGTVPIAETSQLIFVNGALPSSGGTTTGGGVDF
jgi:hypothetical protein